MFSSILMKSENICHKYFFTFFASLVIFERLLFADMDMKVSMMSRLLEEDGDSFAKKAEMYFQKRPELLKLVEETLKHRSEEADLKNCSLIEDLHKVEEQNENLSKELWSNQEELEEERILKVKAKEALKSSEKLNVSHQRELKVLFSDLQMKSENLSDLEDKVEKLEVENQSLTAQLQQKIMVSQGESSDLELKLKCIVDQILGISFDCDQIVGKESTASSCLFS